jgi:TolB-like protein
MSDHHGVGPSPEAVRQQLDRVLASETFANTGRLSRLLRYIVERTLAGEGDQLKEYVLGVEVFDRGDQYDPRLDSIVRVEARRLRAKLEEYYAGAGGRDAVVIAVPRGSYVAIFEEGGAGQPQLAFARSKRGTLAMTLLTAAILLLVVSVAWWTRSAAAPNVVIAVLPFEEFSGTAEGSRLAARLTDAVTSELARLGTLAVVSRTSARQFEGVRRPLREVAQALDAQVVMEGTVDATTGVKVTARLVDASTDRKMWVQEFAATGSDVGALPSQIAARAAEAVLRRR